MKSFQPDIIRIRQKDEQTLTLTSQRNTLDED